MRANLAWLRTTRLRAPVAWMVAFGLVLQMAMPIMATAARASNPLAAGMVCLTTPDGHMAAGAGDPSAPAGDKAAGDCCPACALSHVAKFAAAVDAVSVIAPVPLNFSRLAFAGDAARRATASPTPYSSRGPPRA